MIENELTNKQLADKEKKLLAYELNFILKLMNYLLDVFLIMIISATTIQIFRQI